MRTICLGCLLFLLIAGPVYPQNTTTVSAPETGIFAPDQDSLAFGDTLQADTVRHIWHVKKGYSLLDTISNDTLLTALFKPYLGIRDPYFGRSAVKLKRSMPTVKEVKIRTTKNQSWKFWIIVAILLYVAFVRIVNRNNFRIFILSVFNLKLSEKIWEDQRSFFGFVILQLFAIYIFIAALFVSNWMDLKHIQVMNRDINLFLLIALVLFVSYTLKFLLHIFFGVLLQMKRLGVGMVSNTISVNNFISLIILPLLVFLIFNDNPVVTTILTQTVIAAFFLSVIYRVVRITLLSNSFFSFPKIYLFIYLCAFEILPWFVIIKYLNRFQI